MRAFTNSRKQDDGLNSENTGLNSSNFDQVSKKQKLSPLMNQTFDQPTSSKSSVARFYQYPESKPLRREVHAPTWSSRFSFPGNLRKSCCRDSVRENSGDEMGNVIGFRYDKALRSALKTLRYVSKGEEVREGNEEEGRGVEGSRGEKKLDNEVKYLSKLDNEVNKEGVSEDSSVEEAEIVEDRREGGSVVSGQKWRESDGVVVNLGRKFDGKSVERDFRLLSDSLVSDLNNGDLKADNAGKMLDTLSLNKEPDILGLPAYSVLLDSARKRNPRLQHLGFQIQLEEKHLQTHQLLRPQKTAEVVNKDVAAEAFFIPLTEEEKAEVTHAFSKSNRKKVLVTHKNSNIDITGELLQCLRPRAWLNDEVINVYLELLKERKNREPQKFLKCHFFNTFFYKKLISGRGGYNFQSVRRWTSQKKLGYCLLDCDKIFVPIHKEIHWCLAVINKKDEKFQYLDSLGGVDTQVTKVLARYYVDEVKDKTGKDIDVSSWMQEFVKDLPKQENGFDCGMFMIKYADFYSRGVGLCFSQEHMRYFRMRTVKEILRLKAD